MSSVITVRSGATSCARRFTRWISVPTAQIDPFGLSFTVRMIVSVEPGYVGGLHHFERAFRMHDHFAGRIRLAEFLDLPHVHPRVNAAVALPQNQPRAAKFFRRQSAIGLIGIPQDHLVERHAHLERGVAAEMLVGQHDELLAVVPGPRHRLRRHCSTCRRCRRARRRSL